MAKRDVPTFDEMVDDVITALLSGRRPDDAKEGPSLAEAPIALPEAA